MNFCEKITKKLDGFDTCYINAITSDLTHLLRYELNIHSDFGDIHVVINGFDIQDLTDKVERLFKIKLDA